MPTTDRPPNFAVPERSESPSTVAAIGRPRVPYAETGVTSTRTVSPAGTIEPASVANDPPLARGNARRDAFQLHSCDLENLHAAVLYQKFWLRGIAGELVLGLVAGDFVAFHA